MIDREYADENIVLNAIKTMKYEVSFWNIFKWLIISFLLPVIHDRKPLPSPA